MINMTEPLFIVFNLSKLNDDCCIELCTFVGKHGLALATYVKTVH